VKIVDEPRCTFRHLPRSFRLSSNREAGTSERVRAVGNQNVLTIVCWDPLDSKRRCNDRRSESKCFEDFYARAAPGAEWRDRQVGMGVKRSKISNRTEKINIRFSRDIDERCRSPGPGNIRYHWTVQDRAHAWKDVAAEMDGGVRIW